MGCMRHVAALDDSDLCNTRDHSFRFYFTARVSHGSHLVTGFTKSGSTKYTRLRHNYLNNP